MLSFPKGRDQEDVFLKSGNAMCNIDEASSYHPKYAHVFQRIHWEKGKKHLTAGPAFFSASTLVCTDFCRNKRDEFNDTQSPF